MDYGISFPNLGISLDYVMKMLRIGPLTIALYGICVAMGMVLGVTALMARAKESGQDPDFYLDLSMISLVIAVIGARLYYVVFSWENYRGDLLSILNIREGGLAIYGGIIGAVLSILVISSIKQVNCFTVMDTCVIGLPIGQILGRWGNFFNREAFGEYTDGSFAMRLPVSAVRASEITPKMLEHLQEIDGIRYIQVHPTFLYEGIWNALVLLVLFVMRKRTKFSGELGCIYLSLYGFGRFFIERLRTDQLLIPGTTLPVSMVLSAVLFLVGTAVVVWGRLRTKN